MLLVVVTTVGGSEIRRSAQTPNVALSTLQVLHAVDYYEIEIHFLLYHFFIVVNTFDAQWFIKRSFFLNFISLLFFSQTKCMLDMYTKDDSESFRPFAIKKKIELSMSSCHLYIQASLQIRANQGLKELRSSVLTAYCLPLVVLPIRIPIFACTLYQRDDGLA